jgi:hypothetical protein
VNQFQSARLLATPDVSRGWQQVWRIFTDPIRLIVALRGNGERQHEFLSLLPHRAQLISDRMGQMDETLASLMLVAKETFNAGYRIRDAINQIYPHLAGLRIFFHTAPDTPIPHGFLSSPAEQKRQLAEIGRLVSEKCNNFAEQSLLEGIREAVEAEKGVLLEETVMHRGQTNCYLGITVPAPNTPKVLPLMASATELARIVRDAILHATISDDAVDAFLRRYRRRFPDCFTEVDAPRRNEPRFLYRCDDLWHPLIAHFSGPEDERKPNLTDE